MARAHRVGLVSVVATVAYVLTLYNVLSVPFLDQKTSTQILPVIPWWILVFFGAYSLWSIGWGLLTLRECPEAYDELLAEITEAKNDLRARGVIVD